MKMCILAASWNLIEFLCNPLTSASHLGQPMMPKMTPIRNRSGEQAKPSAPPLPNQLQMPLTTPIFVPAIEESAKPKTLNNRPLQPSPIGKPPPHVHSLAPSITPQPQLEYGKLLIRIINFKAEQGDGPVDPYVRVKLGNTEATTNSHTDGGRKPVSD